MPPIERQNSSSVPPLIPLSEEGPGKLSIYAASRAGVHLHGELGEAAADPELNWDSPHLTADSYWKGDPNYIPAQQPFAPVTPDPTKLQAQGTLDSLLLTGGVEGLEAKVRVVENGQPKLRFSGLSIEDGFFRSRLNDTRDWFKGHKLATGAAAAGLVVATHEAAKRYGPVSVRTGNISVYQSQHLSASVNGIVEITGDKNWVRPKGIAANVNYVSESSGVFAASAQVNTDKTAQFVGVWSDHLSNGLDTSASASFNSATHQKSLYFTVSKSF